MLTRLIYWLVVVFLILPAIALGQEMNNCTSADYSIITRYNATHISSIFDAVECKNGMLELKSGVRTVYVYGNLETHEGSKGFWINNGSLRAESQGDNQLNNENTSITGKSIMVTAESGRIFASTSTGIYTQNGYSFLCSGECELSASITEYKDALNIFGKAVVIKTEYVDEYKNKQEFDRRWIANISNMNGIIVSNAEDINFSALAIKGEFDRTKIESEEFISIRRIGENVHDLITAYGAANISFPEGKNLGAYTANNKPVHIGVIGTSVAFMDFILKEGKVFVLGSKEEFDICAGKSRGEESGLFEESGCIFTNSRIGEEIVQIAPDKPGAKVVMDVSYPLLRVFQNLKIEPFWGQATESILGIIRARSDSRMEFSKENITLKSGNWFDFDTSFSAWVYEPEIQQYSDIVCDIETRQCFFNGTQVYGFEGLRANICRRNSDCGEGMICTCLTVNRCGQKRCVRQASCQKVEDISPESSQNRPLRVLFISDGYDDEEAFISDIKKVVDKEGISGFNGLLSVNPFSDNDFKNSALFYSIVGGDMSYSSYGTSLVPNAHFADALLRQCPRTDMAIVLSNKEFEHYSSEGGNIYLSMPKLSTGFMALHEFGHSFGSLKDEYAAAPIGSPQFGSPNCIPNEYEAKNIWSGLVSEERADEILAENNKGCGGYCTGDCINYLKPSSSSIMSKQYSSEGGNSFNDINEEWLKRQISMRILGEVVHLSPAGTCPQDIRLDCNSPETKISSIDNVDMSNEWIVTKVRNGINQGLIPKYKEAAAGKLPWEMLAVLHLREGSARQENSVLNGGPLCNDQDGSRCSACDNGENIENDLKCGTELLLRKAGATRISSGDIETIKKAFWGYGGRTNGCPDAAYHVTAFFDEIHSNMWKAGIDCLTSNCNPDCITDATKSPVNPRGCCTIRVFRAGQEPSRFNPRESHCNTNQMPSCKTGSGTYRGSPYDEYTYKPCITTDEDPCGTLQQQDRPGVFTMYAVLKKLQNTETSLN